MADRLPIKILIVDDSVTSRQLIRAMLRPLQLPMDVVEAGGGQEAINIVNSNRPDVIFLDIEMPGKSGLHVASEIRSQDKDIMIAVVSGRYNEKISTYLKSINISNQITKPMVPAEIRRIVLMYAASIKKEFNLLIADGSKTVRGMIGSACKLPGVIVHQTMVENGEQLLIEFRINKFDIVFMDACLTEFDGISVVGKMKRMDASCKIVIMTSDPTEQFIRDVASNGASACIVKPFKLEQIQAALKKHLGIR